MSRPKFSHTIVDYVFRGREVPPPKPGTFDPQHYTPRSHQVFHVNFQSDGMWWITLWDTTVASGSCDQRPSCKAAKELLEHHCKRLLQEDSAKS